MCLYLLRNEAKKDIIDFDKNTPCDVAKSEVIKKAIEKYNLQKVKVRDRMVAAQKRPTNKKNTSINVKRTKSKKVNNNSKLNTSVGNIKRNSKKSNRRRTVSDMGSPSFGRRRPPQKSQEENKAASTLRTIIRSKNATIQTLKNELEHQHCEFLQSDKNKEIQIKDLNNQVFEVKKDQWEKEKKIEQLWDKKRDLEHKLEEKKEEYTKAKEEFERKLDEKKEEYTKAKEEFERKLDEKKEEYTKTKEEFERRIGQKEKELLFKNQEFTKERSMIIENEQKRRDDEISRLKTLYEERAASMNKSMEETTRQNIKTKIEFEILEKEFKKTIESLGGKKLHEQVNLLDAENIEQKEKITMLEEKLESVLEVNKVITSDNQQLKKLVDLKSQESKEVSLETWEGLKVKSEKKFDHTLVTRKILGLLKEFIPKSYDGLMKDLEMKFLEIFHKVGCIPSVESEGDNCSTEEADRNYEKAKNLLSQLVIMIKSFAHVHKFYENYDSSFKPVIQLTCKMGLASKKRKKDVYDHLSKLGDKKREVERWINFYENHELVMKKIQNFEMFDRSCTNLLQGPVASKIKKALSNKNEGLFESLLMEMRDLLDTVNKDFKEFTELVTEQKTLHHPQLDSTFRGYIENYKKVSDDTAEMIVIFESVYGYLEDCQKVFKEKEVFDDIVVYKELKVKMDHLTKKQNKKNRHVSRIKEELFQDIKNLLRKRKSDEETPQELLEKESVLNEEIGQIIQESVIPHINTIRKAIHKISLDLSDVKVNHSKASIKCQDLKKIIDYELQLVEERLDKYEETTQRYKEKNETHFGIIFRDVKKEEEQKKTTTFYSPFKARTRRKNPIVYFGEMRFGKRDGIGKEFYKDGKTVKFIGSFKNDHRHGMGEEYDKKGVVTNVAEWDNTNVNCRDDGMLETLDLKQLMYEVDTFTDLLGQGTYGFVYRTTVNGKKFALKRFRVSMSVENGKAFKREVQLLRRFSHPNVVKVYGWTDYTDEEHSRHVGILMEYCPKNIHKRYDEFSWFEKVKILYEVAEGMKYLHSKNVIHRDLKWENVLLSIIGTAKIIDFGLARKVEKYKLFGKKANMTKKIGTPGFIAPEVTDSTEGKYNDKVDVYSFGIMMFSLYFETDDPYGFAKGTDPMYPLQVDELVMNGLRPIVDKDKMMDDNPHSWYFKLMTKCWDQNPSSRPSFKYVVDFLEEKLNMINEEKEVEKSEEVEEVEEQDSDEDSDEGEKEEEEEEAEEVEGED